MNHVRYMLNDPNVYSEAPTKASNYLESVPDLRSRKMRRFGDWSLFLKNDSALPNQGWKIHISAKPNELESVLEAATLVCLETSTDFKIVADKHDCFRRLSKSSSQDQFGKLMTIYPETDDHFDNVLCLLNKRLSNHIAPSILTDIQVGKSPVHFRYGNFINQSAIHPDDGKPTEFLLDPEGNRHWVKRNGLLDIPVWVQHTRLTKYYQKAHECDDPQLPIEITEIIKSSSTGVILRGKYCERDVFIKEARRQSGYRNGGNTEAVDDLHKEWTLLRRLSRFDLFATPIAFLDVGSSCFLIEEYLEGQSLHSYVTENCPIIVNDLGRSKEYVSFIAGVIASVKSALSVCHDNGVTLGDLSPHNIMVNSCGDVHLVDLEAAEIDRRKRSEIWTPGYTESIPPDVDTELTYEDLDLFALRRIAMNCFYPAALVFSFGASLESRLLRAISEFYGSDAAECVDSVMSVTSESFGSEASSAELLSDIQSGRGMANYSEDLNVDIPPLGWSSLEQTDPFGLDSVADFIYYCGRQAISDRRAIALFNRQLEATVTRPSLSLDLAEMDCHRKKSKRAIYDYLDTVEDLLGSQVELPLAQRGLTRALGVLSSFYSQIDPSDSLRNQVSRLANATAEIIVDEASHFPTIGAPGMLYGWSGVISTLLSWVKVGGFSLDSELIVSLIDIELAGTQKARNNRRMVIDADRLLPYFGTGSAGILTCISECSKILSINWEDDVIDSLYRAVIGPFCGQAGLYYGAAGLLYSAQRAQSVWPRLRSLEEINQIKAIIALRSSKVASSTYVLGDQNGRISLDFAHWQAGVHYALQGNSSGPLDWLPCAVVSEH